MSSDPGGDTRPRGEDPRDHREDPRQAGQVPRHPGDDVARGRRQGDPDDDRGPVRSRFRIRRARGDGRRGRRGGRARDDHRQLRRQADPVPGRVDRRARGERHRQRPCRLRRAAARADAVADPRGGSRHRRLARGGRGDRRGREGGGRRDRLRRHQGGRARPLRPDVHLHDRRRPRRPACRTVARRAEARRPHPRVGLGRRSRHGDHARARRVRARRRDRVGLALALAGRRRAARGGRPGVCAACAMRPAAASRPCSTSWPAHRP